MKIDIIHINGEKRESTRLPDKLMSFYISLFLILLLFSTIGNWLMSFPRGW